MSKGNYPRSTGGYPMQPQGGYQPQQVPGYPYGSPHVAPAYPSANVPTGVYPAAPGGYPPNPPTYTPPGVPTQQHMPSHGVYGTQYNMGAPMPGQQRYGPPQPMGIDAGAQFDAGARFDGISQPSIPPAPPGYAPNMAQMAASQGYHVSATQQRQDFIGGGAGGYTFM